MIPVRIGGLFRIRQQSGKAEVCQIGQVLLANVCIVYHAIDVVSWVKGHLAKFKLHDCGFVHGGDGQKSSQAQRTVDESQGLELGENASLISFVRCGAEFKLLASFNSYDVAAKVVFGRLQEDLVNVQGSIESKAFRRSTSSTAAEDSHAQRFQLLQISE